MGAESLCGTRGGQPGVGDSEKMANSVGQSKASQSVPALRALFGLHILEFLSHLLLLIMSYK